MNENAERDEWVLVPREPTPEMLDATTEGWVLGYDDVYRAMVSAAPPPPVQGEVKPLEWVWRSDTNPRFWRAQTVCDWGYRIYESIEDFSTTLGNERFSTPEAAMGACQADYERRIRSALVIEPAPALAQAEGHSAPAGVDAAVIAAMIEPNVWGDDFDPYETMDDGRSAESVRAYSLVRARDILAHLDIPDPSKQGEG